VLAPFAVVSSSLWLQHGRILERVREGYGGPRTRAVSAAVYDRLVNSILFFNNGWSSRLVSDAPSIMLHLICARVVYHRLRAIVLAAEVEGKMTAIVVIIVPLVSRALQAVCTLRCKMYSIFFAVGMI